MAPKLDEKPKLYPRRSGRPSKKIDWQQVEILAAHLWTDTEIAAFYRIDGDTFYAHGKKKFKGKLSENMQRFRDEGKAKLRSKQYSLAMDGNAQLLIWLGKQVLGQSDKTESKNTFNGDVKVTTLLELIRDNVDINPNLIDVTPRELQPRQSGALPDSLNSQSPQPIPMQAKTH